MTNTFQNTPLREALSGPMDATAVELAVLTLEADARFEGSDALKVKLARRLARAGLTGDQRNRLAAVVLRALRHGGDEAFRAYARLAPAVATPIFEAAVNCYVSFCDPLVAGRAAHVLDVLSLSAARRTDNQREAPAPRRRRELICAGAD
jgi:hypothetical protein